MNIAENNFYLRTPLTNIGGDFDGIHESRSRGRKTDHFGISRQHDFGILGDRLRRVGPEAIVQGSLMPVFIQPAGELHDADWRHAVGKDRKIGLTGDKIETGGVNKRDTHNVVLEGSV